MLSMSREGRVIIVGAIILVLVVFIVVIGRVM